MNPGLKKTILAVLIATFILPVTFFVAPKKADAAAASCLMSAMGGIFGGANSVVSSIMAVPVSDKGVNINTATDAGANVGTNLGECLLKTLARVAAQTLIHSFSASVVDWINSGFHGSPSFVSNPEGFFADVGDIAAGSFIQGLGPIGQILCSPFDLNIRIALGLSLGAGGGKYQYVGCRLSDVQKNIYKTFTGGKWGKDGWQNWIAISQPQNNIYGSYLNAKESLAIQIGNKTVLRQQQLLEGAGFLGSEKCTGTGGLNVNPTNPSDMQKYYDDGGTDEDIQCVTQTPGSVIGAQLNKTLSIPNDVLSVSQDIDDILNALVNQAIKQVFSATGLVNVGKSGGSYTGGKTYLSSITSSYQDQLSSGNTLPPTGINCSLSYNIPASMITTDGSGNVTSYIIQYYDHLDADGASVYLPEQKLSGNSTGYNVYKYDTAAKNFSATPLKTYNTALPTPSAYQRQITQGCLNLAVAEPARQEINNLNARGGALDQSQRGAPGSATPDLNVAIAKPAYQSSNIRAVAGAGNAVDGNKNEFINHWGRDAYCSPNSGIPCGAITSAKENDKWWKVDLQGTYNIHNIMIYKPFTDSWGIVPLIDFNLNFYDKNKNPIPLAAEISSSIKTSIVTQNKNLTEQKIEIPNLNINANYVEISSNVKNQSLSIAEVEIYGTQASADSSGSSAPAGPTNSDTEITSMEATVSAYAGRHFTSGNLLTVSTSNPDGKIPMLDMTMKLQRIDGDTKTDIPLNPDPANLADSIFDTLGIWLSIVEDQDNPKILLPVPASGSVNPSKEISVNDPTIIRFVDNGMTFQPAEDIKTFYIDFGGDIKPSAKSGNYIITVNIVESVSKKLVGNQVYNLTIRPTSD